MIELELTPHEIRALLRSSRMIELIFEDRDLPRMPPPEGHTIPPLSSAALKLETALVMERESV
jgi:hypothetical protein